MAWWRSKQNVVISPYVCSIDLDLPIFFKISDDDTRPWWKLSLRWGTVILLNSLLWLGSRVTWSFLIRAKRKNTKNRKYNIFLIDFICLEFPSVCSCISTVISSFAQKQQLAGELFPWENSIRVRLALQYYRETSILSDVSFISSHVFRRRSPGTSFTSRVCWPTVSRGRNHQR